MIVRTLKNPLVNQGGVLVEGLDITFSTSQDVWNGHFSFGVGAALIGLAGVVRSLQYRPVEASPSAYKRIWTEKWNIHRQS
jgi:hypothetical protein